MIAQAIEATPLNAPEGLFAADIMTFEMSQTTAEVSRPTEESIERNVAMKSPSFAEWYQILRAHHQWTLFQAVRYALWLTR